MLRVSKLNLTIPFNRNTVARAYGLVHSGTDPWAASQGTVVTRKRRRGHSGASAKPSSIVPGVFDKLQARGGLFGSRERRSAGADRSADTRFGGSRGGMGGDAFGHSDDDGGAYRGGESSWQSWWGRSQSGVVGATSRSVCVAVAIDVALVLNDVAVAATERQDAADDEDEDMGAGDGAGGGRDVATLATAAGEVASCLSNMCLAAADSSYVRNVAVRLALVRAAAGVGLARAEVSTTLTLEAEAAHATAASAWAQAMVWMRRHGPQLVLEQHGRLGLANTLRWMLLRAHQLGGWFWDQDVLVARNRVKPLECVVPVISVVTNTAELPAADTVVR